MSGSSDKRRLLRVLGGAIGAVVLIALAQSSVGHAVLGGMGLTSGSGGYTELALAQPSQPGFGRGAPSSDVSGPARSSTTVQFTVGNREGESRLYDWMVDFTAGGRTVREASGRVTVARGQRVPVVAPVTCNYTGRVRVEIRIANPRLAVGFWGQCPIASPRSSSSAR
jgi:hypothetical protein